MNFFARLRSLFRADAKEKTSATVKRKKTGFINFFNRSRGYGFIRSKETDAKVFFHITEVEGRFSVGDRVKFDLGQNPKGLVAKNVELVNA